MDPRKDSGGIVEVLPKPCNTRTVDKRNRWQHASAPPHSVQIEPLKALLNDLQKKCWSLTAKWDAIQAINPNDPRYRKTRKILNLPDEEGMKLSIAMESMCNAR
jgi:hypothetical protein